eukprot:2810038-Amphidinium_carterae.1
MQKQQIEQIGCCFLFLLAKFFWLPPVMLADLQCELIIMHVRVMPVMCILCILAMHCKYFPSKTVATWLDHHGFSGGTKTQSVIDNASVREVGHSAGERISNKQLQKYNPI